MTDPNFAALLLVIDRSGSMERIRDDAEGAVNAFLHDQARQPGRCTVRLVQFDDSYEVVHASLPVAEVPAYKLVPRGMTALFDAIGRGIYEFGRELSEMAEDERPGRVLVVVQTDGQENSSREWTSAQINALIQGHRDTYSWDFLFLGANQDAITTGAALGFAKGSSLTFDATASGVRSATASASSYVTAYRSGQRPAFSAEDREAAQQ